MPYLFTLLVTILFAFLRLTPKEDRLPAYYKAQTKTSTAWTASWSYDDRFVAVGNDNGELTIYETSNWNKIKSWKHENTTITRVEWNPKHPILAVAAVSHQKTDSVIQLYNVESSEVIQTRGDSLQGRGVSWSPQGDQVAFVGNKGKITLFTKDGKYIKTLSFTNPRSLFDIDWHPQLNILLAVEEDIYLIDVDRDSLIATYDDGSNNKGILCCQWHPSGRLFVTGDYGHEGEGGEPSYLKYWNREGSLVKQIKESRFEYRNVQWTRDGKYLAAAGNVLLVLDEKAGLVSKTKFDDNNLWGVAWNSAGDKIVTSDQAGNIRITDTQGKILKTFKL